MAAYRPGSRLRNLFHTSLLIGAMAAIAAGIGWLVWGGAIVIWAATAVAVGLVFSQKVPTPWILGLLRAVPLSPAQWSEGYTVLNELSRRAGLEQAPRLYYVKSAAPNAISVGSGKQSAIVLTAGLFQRLNEREMIGVLAHEISHFRANDIGLLKLAETLANLTFLVSFLGLLLVGVTLPLYLFSSQTPPLLLILLLGLAPHVITLLTLALSRTREFEADQGAAMLTGDPDGLASALVKLEMPRRTYWERVFPDRARSSPWLRSHPSARERVVRLLDSTGRDI